MKDANIIMLSNSYKTKLDFTLHILIAALSIYCRIPCLKKKRNTVQKGVCNVCFASVTMTFKNIQAAV